jgi:broad specificity phosphatase PhoE
VASIFLIRHAQASFGTTNYDRLSPLGVQQARILGEFLSATGGPITRIVTGSLRRQRDTAAQIATKLRERRAASPEVGVDSRLDELNIDDHIARIATTLADPGAEIAADLAEAKTSSRGYQKIIRRVFTQWQLLSQQSEPETWPAFKARAREVMGGMMARNGHGESTVAVSSGALIATITQYVLGLPDSAAYGLFEAMKNCSITHFVHSSERISLSSFNDTTYLVALGATSLITYR